jgi:hypothetical protein
MRSYENRDLGRIPQFQLTTLQLNETCRWWTVYAVRRNTSQAACSGFGFPNVMNSAIIANAHAAGGMALPGLYPTFDIYNYMRFHRSRAPPPAARIAWTTLKDPITHVNLFAFLVLGSQDGIGTSVSHWVVCQPAYFYLSSERGERFCLQFRSNPAPRRPHSVRK